MQKDNTMFPGYSLGSTARVKVQKIEFLDSFEQFEINLCVLSQYPDVEKIKVVRDVLATLDSQVNKGFMTRFDLTQYPLINEVLPSFFDLEEDDVYVRGHESMEGYKWLYNLIILNLYYYILDCQKTPEIIMEDLLTDFSYLEKELYQRLDTSIRYHLQKRGLSVKENVYVGFDTEYTQITPTQTRLVSSQLAVSCKTLIHLPTQSKYKLSRLDETTKKLVVVKLSKSFKKVEFSIQMCIEKIRSLKYGRYDESMFTLKEVLKLIRGMSYYEGDDNIVFSLPTSPVQPFIQFGEIFSLEELVKIAHEISKPVCESVGGLVLDLLKDISVQKFSLEGGVDVMLSMINSKYESYNAMKVMEECSGKVLDFLTLDQLVRRDTVEKSVKRITKNLPEKMSITITKTFYLIGHLTPADLGQLSDFATVKEELTIVNGSFVTLGKPLIINDKKVHVRDTMLLAPGGSKSLASIGGLYPNFPKLQISKSDLENMHGFLERDREGFVAYALRDAVITLVHAL